MDTESSRTVHLDFTHTLIASLRLYIRTWPGLFCLAFTLCLTGAVGISGYNLHFAHLLIAVGTLTPLGLSAYLHLLHRSECRESTLILVCRTLLAAVNLGSLLFACFALLMLGTSLTHTLLESVDPVTRPVSLLVGPTALVVAASFVPSFLPLVTFRSMPWNQAWSSSLKASRGVRGTLLALSLLIATFEVTAQGLLFAFISHPLEMPANSPVHLSNVLLDTVHLTLLAFPLAAIYTVTASLSQQDCFQEQLASWSWSRSWTGE